MTYVDHCCLITKSFACELCICIEQKRHTFKLLERKSLDYFVLNTQNIVVK